MSLLSSPRVTPQRGQRPRQRQRRQSARADGEQGPASALRVVGWPCAGVLSSWSVVGRSSPTPVAGVTLGEAKEVVELVVTRGALPDGRATLAGQFLALQAVLLLLVVAVTSVVSVRQSDADFRDDPRRPAAGGRREPRQHRGRAGRPGRRDAAPASLAFYAQQRQDDYRRQRRLPRPTGRHDRRRPDPDRGRATSSTSRPATCTERRAWTGDVDDGGRALDRRPGPPVHRRTPASWSGSPWSPRPTRRSPSGCARPRPTCCRSSALGPRARAWPASWLLARLIKRRTRGLEPAEIAALADQREALLHSLREGVLAVGERRHRHRAQRQRPRAARPARRREGRQLADLDLAPAVRELLLGRRRRARRRAGGRRPGAGAQPQPRRPRRPARSAPSRRCATAPSCWRCRAS